ncbi:D-xylulose reductase A [Colletotrichum sidae]|uniref:D-xylulose reductase A n=1 Tax=Colletotrichum sidae TaxID=1347389 RepID=A0A4R8TP78_9PEZI|nr:D-xylulose reductase A [Colletotrichum sidae]
MNQVGRQSPDFTSAPHGDPSPAGAAILRRVRHRRWTVLVFGCGPVGVLCQAVAQAYGASKVIGVDISESRAQFAKTFGHDEVYV